MSNETKKRWGPFVLGLALLLVLLYVLGSGPADRLAARGYIGPEEVRTLYAPLKWVYDNSTIGRRLLDRYLSWWH